MTRIGRRAVIAGGGIAMAATFVTRGFGLGSDAQAAERFEVRYSDAEWRKRLSPEAYAILRKEGTERPYSSPLNGEKRAGIFACVGCGLPLYSSRTKYDSRTGWPSFWQALPNAVGTKTDYKIGFPRTEVHCRRCGGHLGHIFDDGPKPTGKRHCINGLSLRFRAGRG
jgi:peptide-methionine (R)-S-oxide reductase